MASPGKSALLTASLGYWASTNRCGYTVRKAQARQRRQTFATTNIGPIGDERWNRGLRQTTLDVLLGIIRRCLLVLLFIRHLAGGARGWRECQATVDISASTSGRSRKLPLVVAGYGRLCRVKDWAPCLCCPYAAVEIRRLLAIFSNCTLGSGPRGRRFKSSRPDH